MIYPRCLRSITNVYDQNQNQHKTITMMIIESYDLLVINRKPKLKGKIQKRTKLQLTTDLSAQWQIALLL